MTEWEKFEALMAAPPEDDAGAIIVDYYAIRSAWPHIQAAIRAARTLSECQTYLVTDVDIDAMKDALAALDRDGT